MLWLDLSVENLVDPFCRTGYDGSISPNADRSVHYFRMFEQQFYCRLKGVVVLDAATKIFKRT